MSRHVRLPNGFGQISFVKGKNLRCPWRAMVSLGRRVDGKYNRKIIGYFASYEEAYTALERYHMMTFSKLYETWMAEHRKSLKYPMAFDRAFKELTPLHSAKLEDISDRDIALALNVDVSPTIKSNIILLLRALYDYARDLGYNLPNIMKGEGDE